METHYFYELTVFTLITKNEINAFNQMKRTVDLELIWKVCMETLAKLHAFQLEIKKISPTVINGHVNH